MFEIQLVHRDARIPTKAHEHDACYDLYSVENKTIMPGKHDIISLGFCIAITPGWEMQIRPRSGMAATNGITVLNAPGTIDAGYRNTVKVILYNSTSTSPYIVKIGDRIAQASFFPVFPVDFKQVVVLTSTERGEHGFGSTGK